MKRAIDLGPVEAAAIKTAGGKIRLRLLLTADQLESMLIAARSGDDPPDDGDVTQCDAITDNVTPRLEKTRTEVDDEDDAREAPTLPRVPPTAPVGRGEPKFVIEGTRAWAAWIKAGHPPTLSVRREHQGRVRTGWHFPSLFPPAKGADPPREENESAA